MRRKLVTIQELRDVIDLRIRTSKRLGGRCRLCGVTNPMPLSTTDEFGCNWTVMPASKTIPGCQEFVDRIVDEVMREYNVKV